MTTKLRTLLLSLSAAALVACASTPDSFPALEAAWAEVERVDSHPMAEEVAGNELAKAKDALATAERYKANREDIDLIRHQAYLATKHAEIVDSRISEAQAKERIESSEAERTQVLLEAREQDANRAEAMAARNARQAEINAARADRQEARAEQALAQARELESELKDLQAEQTERGLVLTLGDVLFDTNKSELKPGAAPTLDRLATFLSEQSDRKLMIEGHTDARGDDGYNLTLSERRADAVRAALVERSIDASRLRSKGLGESFPVATNETSAGRQENRRVEIVVSDKNGEFPEGADRVANND